MSLTPLQEKNKILIAVAGSGKTTSLVRQAVESDEKKILFLTYTNENLSNIRKAFYREIGHIPSNVEVVSWFTFLLRDGVRPYHNMLSNGPRAVSISFIQGSRAAIPGLKFVAESDIENYYFDSGRRIYTDVISKFACKCNEKTGGLVINRLEQIYSSIYIDEIQDLAGWDLEFLKLLMHSQIRTKFVGDPRQVTYSTNHAPKNKKYRDEKITDFFYELQERGVCEIQTHETCLRCNQDICDLANRIFPHLPPATSNNESAQEGKGIVLITADDVPAYIDQYDPVMILRYNKDSNTLGYPAINYGASKGCTFDRVLIFPTKGIEKFLKSGDINDVGDKSKFYVAATRARHSVAFVVSST